MFKNVKWNSILVENGHLSMGRLMGWITFGILIYMWLSGAEVSSSLENAFILLCGYNFSKKMVPSVKETVKEVKNRVVKNESDEA